MNFDEEDVVICPRCNSIDVDHVAHEAVGMYGPVVLDNAFCVACGFNIYRGKLIDNSGNIPPKG